MPDYTSAVPFYAFPDGTLEDQEAALATNPLMLRLNEYRKSYAGDPHRHTHSRSPPQQPLRSPPLQPLAADAPVQRGLDADAGTCILCIYDVVRDVQVRQALTVHQLQQVVHWPGGERGQVGSLRKLQGLRELEVLRGLGEGWGITGPWAP